MTSPDSRPDSHVEALLVALRRRRAPRELDGYVVAALQAGARETRAIAAAREHAPRVAPVVLESRVAAAIGGLRAPATLDPFVAQRLALPGAGLAESCLGRLPRLVAPQDLTARLAERGPSGRSGLEFHAPRGRVPHGLSRWAPKVALVVTAALLVIGFGGLFPSAGEERGAAASDWSRPVAGPVPLRLRAQRDVVPAGPVSQRLALTFDFVGYESHSVAPLSREERALVCGLAGEPMEGGS
jgi:hypothetical protein